MTKENTPNLMTFGGHLEVLRRMLFRIIAVAGTFSVIVFTCKETIWGILLAPSECGFTTPHHKISSQLLAKYRKHASIVIMIVAAIL